MQSIADIKYNIERNGTVSSFYTTHVCAADIHQFSQLNLGKIALLSVVGNVETKLFVFIVLVHLHMITPLHISITLK